MRGGSEPVGLLCARGDIDIPGRLSGTRISTPCQDFEDAVRTQAVILVGIVRLGPPLLACRRMLVYNPLDIRGGIVLCNRCRRL